MSAMVEASPVRPAAMPSTRRQHEQYKRMLDAAEELAMTRELDHVQMHDVAKHANVAIGTLYRYFPTSVICLSRRWCASPNGWSVDCRRCPMVGRRQPTGWPTPWCGRCAG